MRPCELDEFIQSLQHFARFAAYCLMRFLYVFPHPDDESFGPAAAMHAQLRAGHDVYLLTLTRGGATKQRHKLNLSVEADGRSAPTKKCAR